MCDKIFLRGIILPLVLHLTVVRATIEWNNNVLEDIGSATNAGFTFLVSGGDLLPTADPNTRYMVSVRTAEPTEFFGDNHFCGGSIITETVVLTAAHCVVDKRKIRLKTRRMLIVAGTPERLKVADTTIQYPVKWLYPHQSYILFNTNDIALIKIKGTFTLNAGIQIIPLPKAPPPYGSACEVYGWGRIYWEGPLADAAQVIKVNIFAQADCLKEAPRYFNGSYCAGNPPDYEIDSCRGDSGGPMICSGAITGIISWTCGCGEWKFPSLYTDVFENVDWINKHLDGALAKGYSLSLLVSTCLVVLVFNKYANSI